MHGLPTSGVSRHLLRHFQRSDGSRWFSRIISELVRADFLHWTFADSRRKDAIVERFDLDRHTFQPFFEDHSDHLSIVVPDQSLAEGSNESEGRQAGFHPVREEDRSSSHRKCEHATPHQRSRYGLHYQRHPRPSCGISRRESYLKALVLSRDGYQVSTAACGCNWRFDIHAESALISCTMTPS